VGGVRGLMMLEPSVVDIVEDIAWYLLGLHLWTLISFELWCRTFLDGAARRTAARSRPSRLVRQPARDAPRA